MGAERFKPTNENIYKIGDIVYAPVNPNLALVVRRYVHNVYYCKQKEHPELKKKVYFERELIALKS